MPLIAILVEIVFVVIRDHLPNAHQLVNCATPRLPRPQAHLKRETPLLRLHRTHPQSALKRQSALRLLRLPPHL